jgi:signal transduction histidine kinase
MRGMARLEGASRPADLLPRGGRWAVFGALTALTVIGLLRHEHSNVAVPVVAAVVTVGAGLLMVVERRGLPFLLSAAIATAGIAVICNGVSSNVGWFAICVLVGWTVLSAGPVAGLVHCAGAVLLFGAEWIWVTSDPGWGPWMAGTTLTALATILVRHDRELVAKLRAAQAGLAEQARTQERNRIARELHDVIAHTLIVSQLHVTSARLAVENDPADAARALAEAERLGRESLAEVRRTVGLLRDDSSSGDIAPLPGAGDLPSLVERFRTAGADVTLTVDGDAGPVPATTGLALYRIVQEALTNTVKHAAGWPVTVDVTVGSGRVSLVVESGGLPGKGSGLGLGSMRERALSVGGTCEAGPGGRGWLVTAKLPA